MYEEAYVDERIDRLEALLGEFIVTANAATKSLTRNVNRLSEEMKEFKAESQARSREADKRMEEFKTEMREDMKEFKDEMKEFKDEMKEFKDEMKEFKTEMKEFKDNAEKEHRKMNKQWGDLANKMGTLVEDIVAPAVRPVVKKYFGCDVYDFMINRKIKNKTLNLQGEFDVVAVSENHVFLVETKSSPNKEKLNDFIENIEKFKQLFPEYTDKKLVPFLASLRFDNNMIQLASEQNIYCLAYREWDYMDILNFDLINY